MLHRSMLLGSGGVAGLFALGLGSTLLAHQDDPKIRDMVPKYEGPGYRAGAAGPQEGHGFSAEGVTLNAWLPIGEFGGSHDNANDCWGYVSPSGREYALLGLWGGTGVVEITDPDNPVVIATVLGAQSLWGDVKVYQHYAYKVTESTEVGIQVLDLSDVDNGNVTLASAFGFDTGNSHNVVIDEESGYLYRVGGHHYGFGAYDLNADPINPPLVAEWADHYIHDAQVVTYTDGPYAGRQIMFACGGSNGGWTDTGLAILDVTNKQDTTMMSRLYYADNVYSHQAWLSEDNQRLYLNDELDEGSLGIPTNTKVIDVANLDAPVELPDFTNGNPAIGHNLYVRGDYIFEANYTSGLRIFDINAGESPAEVAYFDTWPSDDDVAYNSLWSTYPLFPSGTVIASDRQQGLWVFTVDVLQDHCSSDLDGSGAVDFGDIVTVLAVWGQPGGPEDLDGSGTVDFGDINILLGDWGTVCP